MKATEAWRCGHCDEVHHDEDDARDCCQPSIDKGWACEVCNEFHHINHQAAQCCMDAESWYCAQCDQRYFFDVDCCEHIDFDAPLMPTPEQLEAHGQQRLLP